MYAANYSEIYEPTINIFRNKCTSWYNIHNIYKNSYMFRQPDVILSELLQHKGTRQTANVYFVHSFKLNQNNSC
jgi:imidazoleglycerol phosphate synthase glutamine amidotransferase subunit HisH